MTTKRYQCSALSAMPPELGVAVLRPLGPPTFATETLNYWDGIATLQAPGDVTLGWFELSRRSFVDENVERHMLTPEALLCLQGPAMCLLGKSKEPSDLGEGDFRAFVVEEGQGIVLFPGVWHSLPFPVSEKALFWVAFRRGTAQEDLQSISLAKEQQFQFGVSL